ncbi:hypothetical protein KsCSTR_19970 [Candidatus Kuenenia stuttgartiensis]|jgi:hypothetical protein|uniref:Uncharacterized protein n=1 Tax=Kuenenia stuttgartiensis TaxID=174633 RepID=Q1Q2P4_KUEST|nr:MULTISPECIES: hypothetical protein [Kuenenia]MBE7548871.1 hypothetical protein [Planctomycetia bacterium]MBZ0190797.1 hypothetical protein [Candidatus Kuenenia stuttgartiensis]MCF6151923.1 hypothetical protein [Candidatus Kuenenia stuttgartiensis]MCL4726080.1 hypothetical protein [Candidatus Kuenenia stuttgartiensis]MCZ7622379.1 hypothetical protein [Candidatus Kuenenia sp.]
MSTVSKIKEAIETLPENEYVQLRQWFLEKDWEKWDNQILADSEAGTLDPLIKEAFEEKSKGKLKEL